MCSISQQSHSPEIEGVQGVTIEQCPTDDLLRLLGYLQGREATEDVAAQGRELVLDIGHVGQAGPTLDPAWLRAVGREPPVAVCLAALPHALADRIADEGPLRVPAQFDRRAVADGGVHLAEPPEDRLARVLGQAVAQQLRPHTALQAVRADQQVTRHRRHHLSTSRLELHGHRAIVGAVHADEAAVEDDAVLAQQLPGSREQ
mmetsp:Transcript_48086/g.124651  ORF Transcript_48086/g.124651 Transcript_48086/m.124651 type:complete len:203 (-) Transcript_48086:266-874(-)